MRPRCCLRCLIRFGASIRPHRPPALRAPRRAPAPLRPPAPRPLGRRRRLGGSGGRSPDRTRSPASGTAPRRGVAASGAAPRARPSARRLARVLAGFAPRSPRSARACARARRALGLLLAVGHLVAVVDPHLHADRAERRLRGRRPEVHLRAERVQRHPALAVPLLAAHVGTAEAPRARHAHAQRTGAHRRLDGAAHRPAERHPPGELLGDALREQRGVRVRPHLAGGLVHVLDLHVHALLRVPLDVLAQAVHLGALAADHDAGAGRADVDPDLIALALDVDRGDPGARQPRADVLADPDVLVERLDVVAPVRVPVRFPGVDDPQPEPVWVDLLSHYASSPIVSTTTVTCDVRLRTRVARP